VALCHAKVGNRQALIFSKSPISLLGFFLPPFL